MYCIYVLYILDTLFISLVITSLNCIVVLNNVRPQYTQEKAVLTIHLIFMQNWTQIWILDPHPVAEIKEFERRFKFKPRLKYGWFHLKLYQMFQDLNRRLIQTGFWRI